MLASNGGSVWWDDNQHMFNEGYRKAVEAALSDLA
jgi:hypothetical protein